MKKLYYRLILKFTGLPNRSQVRELRDLQVNSIFYKKTYNRTMKYHRVLDLYIDGEPIDSIAFKLDITRERTKQLLLRVLR